MPEYRLTSSAWLAREAGRAKGTLLVHLEKGRSYSIQEILTLLADYGLRYTNPEYAAIGQQLIAEGILEAVP